MVAACITPILSFQQFTWRDIELSGETACEIFGIIESHFIGNVGNILIFCFFIL
jgi:hypothetical protein